ncbi:hypothetical protein Dimus_026605 [Dionaea muscipula]
MLGDGRGEFFSPGGGTGRWCSALEEGKKQREREGWEEDEDGYVLEVQELGCVCEVDGQAVIGGEQEPASSSPLAGD